MRPQGSPRELEVRRIRAMRLLNEGRSLSEVAQMVGCYPSAVMRWRNAMRRYGQTGIRAKPITGRPPKLTSPQRAKLERLLLNGAMTHGYRTDLWTTQRIADLIEHEFRIRYHRDHVGRLLHRLDWSCQKPDRCALERNEARITAWKQKQWPRIKKGLRTWAPTSSSLTSRGSN